MPIAVEQCFKEKYPELVDHLKKPGNFWPKIANNTISEKDLDDSIKLERHSADKGNCYFASVALREARNRGIVPIPQGEL